MPDPLCENQSAGRCGGGGSWQTPRNDLSITPVKPRHHNTAEQLPEGRNNAALSPVTLHSESEPAANQNAALCQLLVSDR